MRSVILRENKPFQSKNSILKNKHSVFFLSIRILIETFDQIVLERNRYARDLSTNQVDNELAREQVATFVRDRKRRAENNNQQ